MEEKRRICWLWMVFFVFVESDAIYYPEFMNDAKTHLAEGSPCMKAIEDLIENAESDSDDLWGPKLLDASSKFPTGILEWNFGDLGNFDECINTVSKNGDYKGRHCQTAVMDAQQMYPMRDNFDAQLDRESIQSLVKGGFSLKSKVTSFAICLPTQCNEGDVYSITANYSFYWMCHTKEEATQPITTGFILTLTFLGIIVLLMATSTLYSIHCKRNDKEPWSPTLFAFSVDSNGRKAFAVSKNPAEIQCINGIRVLCCMWIVAYHVFITENQLTAFNGKDGIKWSFSREAFLITFGTLAVDTFFCISGIVLVVSFLSSATKTNSFNIIKYYLHRYNRITPALAATILVVVNVFRYFGSGPFYNTYLTYHCDPCYTDWWKLLLYIHNYDLLGASCISQAWYLIVDFQLYIFSPLLLWPLWKKPKIGLALIVAALCISTAWAFYTIWDNMIWALAISIYEKTTYQDRMRKFYVKSYLRAGPWLVGLLYGYVIYLIRKKQLRVPKLNQALVATLWMIIVGIIVICIFVPYSTLAGPDYDRFWNAVYLPFHKLAWSCCIGLGVLLCYTGHGGIVNWLLSLPIFQILSRFTYSIYLIHLDLINIKMFSRKTGIHFSPYDLILEFLGTFGIAFFISIFWVLAFESPMMLLEKSLYNALGIGDKPKPKAKLPDKPAV